MLPLHQRAISCDLRVISMQSPEMQIGPGLLPGADYALFCVLSGSALFALPCHPSSRNRPALILLVIPRHGFRTCWGYKETINTGITANDSTTPQAFTETNDSLTLGRLSGCRGPCCGFRYGVVISHKHGV